MATRRRVEPPLTVLAVASRRPHASTAAARCSHSPIHTYQTWNWVIWVIFKFRVTILTRCQTRVFPVFEKMPKMQNVHLKCGYEYSYLLTYVVEYSIRYSTEYSSSKKLDSHTPTQVDIWSHYRTGSPGQLGLRVAGFLGHWVTKCDPVPCLIHTYVVKIIVPSHT